MLDILEGRDIVNEEESQQRKVRPVVELSSAEARNFFLKHESYFTTDLPNYVKFDRILTDTAEVLRTMRLRELRSRSPRGLDEVNHTILANKDGRYAWRPLELIHPAIYVSLVNSMTEPSQWQLICNRFRNFDDFSSVKCLSLPVESLDEHQDKGGQINRWWWEVEQKSIELALDYEFMVRTDISDCYSAIYTHSIAWALHGKAIAKANQRCEQLIGNVIDSHLQDMRRGQTNGIPQGPVLMDFIAEMVLGFADNELTATINTLEPSIEDYQILRYRDDYRIFVNDTRDGERIIKTLTEVLIDLGLQLNPSKTDLSGDVIQSSIKADKLDWLFRKQDANTLQKRLLIIHDHSRNHPNSGSLRKALRDYYEELLGSKSGSFPLPLISIVADIAYRNPGTYAVSSAILSKLIDLLEVSSDEKQNIIERIRRKFSRIPNTGYMEIWLQRISLKFAPQFEYDTPLCRLVEEREEEIWNNDWIDSKLLLNAVDARKIIIAKEIERMPTIIPIDEFDAFGSRYG